jgi:hypothetical protein
MHNPNPRTVPYQILFILKIIACPCQVKEGTDASKILEKLIEEYLKKQA